MTDEPNEPNTLVPVRPRALLRRLLPCFLFGVNANRVKPELRERSLRCQAGCYEVRWTAIKGASQTGAAAPPVDRSPVEQALLAEAVASMAREHLTPESRVATRAEYTRGFIQQIKRYQA